MEFEGTLKITGKKSISIRGIVRGEVKSDGEISVEAGGAIHGSIATHNLEVFGLVQTDQDVEVTGVLSMRAGGRLIASNISYSELEQEKGARISGQLQPYDDEAVAPPDVESDVAHHTLHTLQNAVAREPEDQGQVRWASRSLGSTGNIPPGALGRALRSVMDTSRRTHEEAPAPVAGVTELPFSHGVRETSPETVDHAANEHDGDGLRSLEVAGG